MMACRASGGLSTLRRLKMIKRYDVYYDCCGSADHSESHKGCDYHASDYDKIEVR
jgi:hypothetical protein